MSVISNFSRYLANEIKSGKNPGANGEVFTYAIIVLLTNVTAIGGIVLAAWLLGTLKATALVWLAFVSLRLLTGGRHQAGPVTCWLLSVSVFTLLGLLVTHIPPAIRPFTSLIEALGIIFTLYAVIAYAPVTIPSKKFKPGKRKTLKTAAIMVVILWAAVMLNPSAAAADSYYVLHLAIITGLLAQAISILPITLKR